MRSRIFRTNTLPAVSHRPLGHPLTSTGSSFRHPRLPNPGERCCRIAHLECRGESRFERRGFRNEPICLRLILDDDDDDRSNKSQRSHRPTEKKSSAVDIVGDSTQMALAAEDKRVEWLCKVRPWESPHFFGGFRVSSRADSFTGHTLESVTKGLMASFIRQTPNRLMLCLRNLPLWVYKSGCLPWPKN